MPGLLKSPIELELHTFESIQMFTSEDENAESTSSIRTNRVISGHNSDPTKFQLSLTVEINAEVDNPKYKISICVNGFFKIEKDQLDRSEDLITVTGASILYGSCREMILNLTGRSAHSALRLPSVTFPSTRVIREEREAAEANVKATPKRKVTTKKGVKRKSSKKAK